MPFEIIFTDKSRKDLKLLDKSSVKRIFKKIDGFSKKEFVPLEKVKGTDFFKLRIGVYRVFIKKFPVTKKLVILHIRHRRTAYKKI